jgi:xanthine dehydrogenase accessory factor
MPSWLDHIVTQIEQSDASHMLVTVAETAGSVPREAGARMVVGSDTLEGTIGGGQLEFEAIAEARNRLKGNRESGLVVYPLGPELGQCCGGSVSVLFEDFGVQDLDGLKQLRDLSAQGPVARAVRYAQGAIAERVVVEQHDSNGSALAETAITALAEGKVVFAEGQGGVTLAEPVIETRPALWLFGAGHVGKAMAQAVAELPFRLTWIDNRAEMFGEDAGGATHLVAARPELAVDDAPAGSYFLVMTHSHPLDQDICEAVLRRGDAAYLGLIGSKTKKAQFLKRLKAKGLSQEKLNELTCPIGLTGITGKAPAVIAASVAADLLMRAKPA